MQQTPLGELTALHQTAGNLQCSPRSLAVFKGPTKESGRGRQWEWVGKGREKRMRGEKGG